MASERQFYALLLHGINSGFDLYTLDSVFVALAHGIRNCEKAIEESKIDGDYNDIIVDSEIEVIENILGAAFVVCQSVITSVVSAVRRLHKFHERRTGRDLTTTTGEKRAIMKIGRQQVGNSGYMQVEVMDAFANYFKHREEWRGSWSSLTGIQRQTATVIQAVGAQRGSTGNLRTGAKVLGNVSFRDLMIFSRILDEWQSDIHHKYQAELKSRGLL